MHQQHFRSEIDKQRPRRPAILADRLSVSGEAQAKTIHIRGRAHAAGYATVASMERTYGLAIPYENHCKYSVQPRSTLDLKIELTVIKQSSVPKLMCHRSLDPATGDYHHQWPAHCSSGRCTGQKLRAMRNHQTLLFSDRDEDAATQGHEDIALCARATNFPNFIIIQVLDSYASHPFSRTHAVETWRAPT